MKKYNICFMFQGQPRYVDRLEEHYKILFETWKNDPSVDKVYIRGNFWDTKSVRPTEKDIKLETGHIECRVHGVDLYLGGIRKITQEEINNSQNTFNSLSSIVDDVSLNFYDQIRTLFPYCKRFVDYAVSLRKIDPTTRDLINPNYQKIFNPFLQNTSQVYSKFMYHDQVPDDTDVVLIIRSDVLPSIFGFEPLGSEHMMRKLRSSVDYFIEQLGLDYYRDYIHGDRIPNIIWPRTVGGVGGVYVDDLGCWGMKGAFDLWCSDFEQTWIKYWNTYARVHYPEFTETDFGLSRYVGCHELHVGIKYNEFNGLEPSDMKNQPCHVSLPGRTIGDSNHIEPDIFINMYGSSIVRETLDGELILK